MHTKLKVFQNTALLIKTALDCVDKIIRLKLYNIGFQLHVVKFIFCFKVWRT